MTDADLDKIISRHFTGDLTQDWWPIALRVMLREVAAAERERCAQICDSFSGGYGGWAGDCASAIRESVAKAAESFHMARPAVPM